MPRMNRRQPDPDGDHLDPKSALRPRGTGPDAYRLEISTQILAGLALLAALEFGLLASLLAGLLVYDLVQALAPTRTNRFVHRHTAKIIVVALLAAGIVGAVTAAI